MRVTVEGVSMSEVVLMASLKVLYEREFKRTPNREELIRFTKAFIASSPEVKVYEK